MYTGEDIVQREVVFEPIETTEEVVVEEPAEKETVDA